MDKETLKISFFGCATSFDKMGPVLSYREPGVELMTVLLPCSGKIDILYLTKAFETGADGVAVIMCPEGECRYLEGNLRARKRAEAVDALLEEIGLSKGRVAIIQMKDGGAGQAVREWEDFLARVRALPKPVAAEQVMKPDSGLARKIESGDVTKGRAYAGEISH